MHRVKILYNPYQGLKRPVKPTRCRWAYRWQVKILYNPYQGLKRTQPQHTRLLLTVKILYNPYQGLKRRFVQLFFCFLESKSSIIPIRD